MLHFSSVGGYQDQIIGPETFDLSLIKKQTKLYFRSFEKILE